MQRVIVLASFVSELAGRGAPLVLNITKNSLISILREGRGCVLLPSGFSFHTLLVISRGAEA